MIQILEPKEFQLKTYASENFRFPPSIHVALMFARDVLNWDFEYLFFFIILSSPYDFIFRRIAYVYLRIRG